MKSTKNLIFIIPLCFCLMIFFIDTDWNAKRIALFTSYIILATAFDWKRKGQIEATVVLLVVLAAITLFLPHVYFILVILMMSLFTFMLFKKVGINVEDFFGEKIHVLAGVLIKLLIWIFGIGIYIFLFFVFLFNFLNNYPKNPVAISLAKSINSFSMIMTSIIFCIILMFFILDFLIKLIKTNLKTLNLDSKLNSTTILIILLHAGFAIIFVDLTYSVLYFSLTDDALNGSEGITNIFSLFKNRWDFMVQSFFYSFCLHFAIPLPSSTYLDALDKKVRNLPYLQIIEFFHFCLNKLVDLTILGSIAGAFTKALGIPINQGKQSE
ncbi:hypothetical protein [Paenibacillus chibensis]|uniref:hypothetical protein n=2 Tax=Paenibacillus chibensis TaxID=59846 RepID=UPI000FDC5FCA